MCGEALVFERAVLIKMVCLEVLTQGFKAMVEGFPFQSRCGWLVCTSLESGER